MKQLPDNIHILEIVTKDKPNLHFYVTKDEGERITDRFFDEPFGILDINSIFGLAFIKCEFIQELALSTVEDACLAAYYRNRLAGTPNRNPFTGKLIPYSDQNPNKAGISSTAIGEYLAPRSVFAELDQPLAIQGQWQNNPNVGYAVAQPNDNVLEQLPEIPDVTVGRVN